MEGLLTQLIAFDTALFRTVNSRFESALLDQLMLTVSAHWFWVLLLGSLATGLALAKKWHAFRMIMLSFVVLGCCDVVTSYGLKENIERLRPCQELQDVRLVQPKCGSRFGFPSNHAANAGAIAMAVHLLFGVWTYSIIAILLATIVAYSRVHLGVHYPLDVTAGMLFGAFVAIVLLAPFRKKLMASQEG